MALWKEPAPKDLVSKESGTKEAFPPPMRDTPAKDEAAPPVIEKTALEKVTLAPAPSPVPTNLNDAARKNAVPQSARESIIASDLIIEGKIEGMGHVRIAGKFKGDVHVQGNLTIEPGAQLTGEVRADAVIVGGDLSGNIEAASRVELSQTGVLNGDLKAGQLIVAAGSKMRGRVEFGWGEQGPASKK